MFKTLQVTYHMNQNALFQIKVITRLWISFTWLSTEVDFLYLLSTYYPKPNMKTNQFRQ